MVVGSIHLKSFKSKQNDIHVQICDRENNYRLIRDDRGIMNQK